MLRRGGRSTWADNYHGASGWGKSRQVFRRTDLSSRKFIFILYVSAFAQIDFLQELAKAPICLSGILWLTNIQSKVCRKRIPRSTTPLPRRPRCSLRCCSVVSQPVRLRPVASSSPAWSRVWPGRETKGPRTGVGTSGYFSLQQLWATGLPPSTRGQGHSFW